YFSYGPLNSIMNDADINEIIINGYQDIYYEKKGKWHQHSDRFISALSYHNLLQKICHEAQVLSSKKTPFACGKWHQFRIHICTSEISGDTCVSLRRHPEDHWTFRKLLDYDWCSDAQLEVLQEILVEKENIL